MADGDPESIEGLALRAAQALLKELLNTRDIPVCHTRTVRKGKGYPWKGRIAIHPLEDGRLHITQIPE